MTETTAATVSLTVPAGAEPLGFRVLEQGVQIEVVLGPPRSGDTGGPCWVVRVMQGYPLATAIPDAARPWNDEPRHVVTEASFPFGYAEGDVRRDAALASAVEYGRRVAALAVWHRAALLEHHAVLARDVAQSAVQTGGVLTPPVAPAQTARVGAQTVTRAALGLPEDED